jgi:small subunit ribosomal protein S17
MSETENEQTTEPGETVETDVETAAQPEGSQPTEVPAAEPETPAEEVPAEAEATPEPEAAAEVPEPQPEAAPAEETSPEAPVAAPAETPAAGAAPPQPAGEPRRRSRRHVPRSLRRQRTRRPAPGDQPKERKAIVRLEKPEHERGRTQERRGVVVSDAMDKTIVVKVESVRAHQRYKKVIRRSVKFHAHDEQNQAHVGDRVRIVETRPLSKTKRWRLAEILEVAK